MDNLQHKIAIQAFVIDPLMKDDSQSYVRSIKMPDVGLAIKDIFTEEEFEFIKTKTVVG